MFVLRKAKEEDINTLTRIDAMTYPENFWSKEIFTSEIKSEYATYLIFKKEPFEVIAYIGAWEILDEGHITTLVVDEKYRNNGIADILLYSLILILIKKSISSITLEVRASNYAAINLYKKYGFLQIGIRKNYYHDTNESALILWLYNLKDTNVQKKIKDIFMRTKQKRGHTDIFQYVISDLIV